MRVFQENVQCHSLSVGDRIRCGEIDFPNITYSLMIIGQDVIRLPFSKMGNVTHFLLVREDMRRLLSKKCAMSLTSCWLKDKNY